MLDNGMAGIVTDDLAASELGSVKTRGIFDAYSATGTTFSAGDAVYWDESVGAAIAEPGAEDDIYLGVAVDAKASGVYYVRVDLNEPVASPMQPALIASRAVIVQHDSTAKHTLINAANNPNGLIFLSIHGVVTEAMVGSSEDQLVITIYDEDDNALSTLTATDGAADSIGDHIIGTLTLAAGATGGVAAVLPAGKACYAKVSQATVGGTPAGAVRVQVVAIPWT